MIKKKPKPKIKYDKNPRARGVVDKDGRTAIELRRDQKKKIVIYVPLLAEGLDLNEMSIKDFDERFQMVDTPIEAVVRLYTGYALDLGASEEVMDEFAGMTEIAQAKRKKILEVRAGPPVKELKEKKLKPKLGVLIK